MRIKLGLELADLVAAGSKPLTERLDVAGYVIALFKECCDLLFQYLLLLGILVELGIESVDLLSDAVDHLPGFPDR